jgi:hypothetical protein
MSPKSCAALVVIGIPVICFGMYRAYLGYWTSWSARAEGRIGVYSTEVDAAYHRGSPAAIAYFEPGDEVAVIRDTYGKDYWACHVRAESGARGWILCTDLPNHGSH